MLCPRSIRLILVGLKANHLNLCELPFSYLVTISPMLEISEPLLKDTMSLPRRLIVGPVFETLDNYTCSDHFKLRPLHNLAVQSDYPVLGQLLLLYKRWYYDVFEYLCFGHMLIPLDQLRYQFLYA